MSELTMSLPGYYTTAEFIARCGFSRQRLHQMFDRGKGPQHVRQPYGRSTRVLIPRIEGDEWLAQHLARNLSRKAATAAKSEIRKAA